MKKIEAIIKPFKPDHAKEALLAGMGTKGLTGTEVKGFGRQRGHKEIYRSAGYQVDFVAKIKLEVVVDSSQLGETIAVMQAKARMGRIGDGKIFVVPVEETIRFRTGESGVDAV
jgi:nitrogen regulatory protein PII